MPPTLAPSTRPAPPARLDLLVLVAIAVVTWSVSHAYQQLAHDARLYTLLALAHIHPRSLPADVFLKFGSQDRFTIFSDLYGTAMRLLGVDTAATVLTLASQAGLVACAWALAKTVLPASAALLGVVVLIAIPGDYGADRIFTCIEGFLTPRMVGEALVLASLAAALGDRRRSAIVLLAAAALIHPVMALAGASALYCLYLGRPKPALAATLAIVGVKALVIVWFLMPAGQWGRFDAAWLDLVRNRSPYLFLGYWQLDDWAGAAVTLVTLTLGTRAPLAARVRALCGIALVTVLAGFTLTLIACDLLHLVLFTQLQPWRWQWLGTVVAALMLPEIGGRLWGANTAGRATALMLIAAWIFGSNAYSLAACGAALASWVWLHRLKPNEVRWVVWGACGLLAIAVLWRVASNLEFTAAHYMDSKLPLWLRRTMSFCRDGSAPGAVMALAYRLSLTTRGRPALWLLAAFMVVSCMALLPQTWRAWTAGDYSPERIAQFAALRDRIHEGADVFWAESPLGAWVLLDRPSYLSAVQTSGVVFSRDSAMELDRRAHALSAALSPETFMNWSAGGGAFTLSEQQLTQACHVGAFGYLVTGRDLGVTPVAETESHDEPARKKFRLYRCPIRPG